MGGHTSLVQVTKNITDIFCQSQDFRKYDLIKISRSQDLESRDKKRTSDPSVRVAPIHIYEDLKYPGAGLNGAKQGQSVGENFSGGNPANG